MAEAVGLAARIVLAGVFAFAAVAKLRAPRELLTTLVPPVELALAAWLLLDRAHARPALAAAGVLVAFTVVLVRAELRHEPCMCFGAGASTRPVGPTAVVRNGVLLALSALAANDVRGADALPVVVTTIGFAVVAFGLVALSGGRGDRAAPSPR